MFDYVKIAGIKDVIDNISDYLNDDDRIVSMTRNEDTLVFELSVHNSKNDSAIKISIDARKGEMKYNIMQKNGVVDTNISDYEDDAKSVKDFIKFSIEALHRTKENVDVEEPKDTAIKVEEALTLELEEEPLLDNDVQDGIIDTPIEGLFSTTDGELEKYNSKEISNLPIDERLEYISKRIEETSDKIKDIIDEINDLELKEVIMSIAESGYGLASDIMDAKETYLEINGDESIIDNTDEML